MSQSLQPSREELLLRLEKAEEALRAIRSGEVDANVVSGTQDDQGVPLFHRIMIEEMNEGALTLSSHGTILYCNARFLEMIGHPLETVPGKSFLHFVIPSDQARAKDLLEHRLDGKSKGELTLGNGQIEIPVRISLREISLGGEFQLGMLITDLTEHRRIDGELRSYQQRFEELVQEQTSDLKRANERLQQEIIERRQVEEELRLSEERFRLALKNVPVSVAVQDRDLRFIWAYNQRTVDPRSVIGKMDADIFPAEDTARLVALKRRVLETEKELHEQFWISSGGQRKYLDLFIEPQRDPSGQVTGIGIATVDLTQIRLTEEALLKNEATLRGILDATRESIWLFSLDGIILMANETALLRLGKSANEVIGESFKKLIPSDLAQKRQTYLEKTALEGQPFEAEDQRDGIVFQHTFYPVKDADGQVIQIVSYSRDITARKQAEEALQKSEARFRSVLDNSRDVIYRLDVQSGHYEYISPSAEKIVGVSVNELMAMDVEMMMTMIHPDDLPMVQAMRTQMDQFGEGELEYRQRTKSGEYRWLSNHISQVKDSDGRTLYRNGNIRDITESKRVEYALRLSEMELSHAQSVARIGNWKWNLENGEITWSDEMYRIFGIDKNSFTGRLGDVISKVIHPDDLYLLLPSNSQSLAEKKPIEYRIILPDKSIRNIWAKSGEAILDDKDRPIFMTGIAQDITERKQAEEMLRRNRALLQAVLDNIPEAIFLKDNESRILLANPATLAVIGKPAEAVIGKTDAEFYDDPATGRAIMDNDRRIMNSGQVEVVEESVPGRSGTRVYLSTKAPYRDADGQIIGLIGIARDITERKRMEEALQRSEALLLETGRMAKVGGWEFDLKTMLPAWTLEIYRIHEVDPSFHLDMENTLDFYPPEARSQITEAVRLSITQGQPYDLELPLITATGRNIWIRMIGRPEFCDGRCVRLFGTLQDITERKQAEDALLKAHNELEQRVEERTRELAAVNKDLRDISRAEHLHRQFSDSLVEAALALNKSMKLDEALPLILEKIRGVIPYQFASITLLDGKFFYEAGQQAGFNLKKSQLDSGNRLLLKDFALLEKMRQSGQPLLIPDTRLEPDWTRVEGLEWSRAFLSAPLLVEGKVIGFVNLFAGEPGFFTEAMCARLVAFAAHASVAIQNVWLFEQVRAGSERLQSLSHRLVEIQESERLYIARELHDEAGQALTSLMLDVRLLEKSASDPQTVLKRLADMEATLEEVTENLHNIAMALRPASLDHLGLVAALRQLIQSVGQKQDLKISFKSIPIEKRLPANVETVIYRIVQEALTNVVRHAHASAASLILTKRDHKLIIIIEDDGIGFNPDIQPTPGHLGLFGMQERAQMIDGTLVIESAPGHGTTIMVEVNDVDSIIGRG